MNQTQIVVNKKNIAAVLEENKMLKSEMSELRTEMAHIKRTVMQSVQEQQRLHQQVIGMRTQVLGHGST